MLIIALNGLHKVYIKISDVLHEKVITRQESEVIWSWLRTIFYGIAYPLSLTVIPFFLLKKRINQLDCYY